MFLLEQAARLTELADLPVLLLRPQAAGQVSALKAQRIALQQYVYRIANKDI